MYSVKLLIFWLLAEPTAILALFGDHSTASKLLIFTVCHLIASGCLAALLTGALPGQEEIRRSRCLALFLSFSFFIPLLGGIGMLASLVYFRLIQRHKERVEFTSVPLSTFMQESGQPAPGMGEGGAWSRLRNDSVPREERLKALLAVGTGGGQNTSRILQLATMDSDEEIRLLAFNLSDRREKVISKTISEALRDLQKASDRKTVADLCRKLAFSYWEMVFSELAQKELARFFVNQSLDYANRALANGGDDAGLLLLTGRLHLWLGDVPAAKNAIAESLAKGAHRDRAIPYLAEIAYRQQDFATLRGYFAQYPFLQNKPGIGQVATFWME